MKSLVRALSVTAAIFLIGMVVTMTIQAQNRRLVQDRFATVGGVRLHYLEAGKGEPVILLHGYAQNSHMWRPLMIRISQNSVGNRARSARIRTIIKAGRWLRQEDDGPGCPWPRCVTRV